MMNILVFRCLIHIVIRKGTFGTGSVLSHFKFGTFRTGSILFFFKNNEISKNNKKILTNKNDNDILMPERRVGMKKERIKYILIFIVTFIIEVIIAKYVHDKIIRPYIGDVLVVICLYTFAKSIFLDKIKWLSLYVLIFAVIVEILQYFNYAQILFGDNKIAKTLLGSSFDVKDILCYVAGYLIIILIEKILHKRKEVKQNENSR